MSRYSPTVLPEYYGGNPGDALAQALTGFAEYKHRDSIEKQQREDSMLGLELSHPGLHRPGTAVPTGQGSALASALPNSPVVEDEYSGDQGPTGMPSDLGFGRSLAGALPAPPLKPTHSGRGAPPPVGAAPIQAGAPTAPPPAGHPGAFDPVAGAFRDGKGVPKIGSQPVAAPVPAAPRVRQITGGWTMNDDEADAAVMRPKELERAFADRDRGRKVQSLMRAYQIPQEKAEALVDNPGLADNELYPTRTLTPRLVRGKDGAYIAVDPTSGMGPDGKPVQGYDAPRSDMTLVPVQQPDGTVLYTLRSQAVGERAPAPSNAGGATIQKALAENTTQLSIIDDALSLLEQSPDAVGLRRGLPVVGDALDQRADPNGVAARAQIANIGSLLIHDRSGAAVTVSEAPRLKPFVPNISDTPATIQTKLTKLRQAIQTESDALRGGPPAAASSGGTHSAVSDEDFARAWKAGIHDDAAIAEWVKKNPVKKP